MKGSLFKSYLKYSYKGLIVWFIVIILSNFRNGGILVFNLAIFFAAIILESYRYKETLEKIKRLKARGLTEKDLLNIEFVKKWDETRKEGLWKYCIRYGGIIAGAILSLVFSLLFFGISDKNITELFAGPGNMLTFIGYAYLAGAVSGIIIYRILWIINERRFLRLTDPLNTLFSGKEASFNDLV